MEKEKKRTNKKRTTAQSVSVINVKPVEMMKNRDYQQAQLKHLAQKLSQTHVTEQVNQKRVQERLETDDFSFKCRTDPIVYFLEITFGSDD